MDQDKADLIADIKALEAELEQAKQETKVAQEYYETARKQLLDAQQMAEAECEQAYQEHMAVVAALRKAINQTHFDTQQQLCQLRQELANIYGKIYKSPSLSEGESAK